MPNVRDLPDGIYRVEQRITVEGEPRLPKFTPMKKPRWWPAFLSVDAPRSNMLADLDEPDREKADA